MSNLSKETRERIEREAKYYLKYGQPKHKTLTEAKYAAYNEGALHEAGRAQGLVDALELTERKLKGINDTVTNDIVSIVNAALAKYKEVGNG